MKNIKTSDQLINYRDKLQRQIYALNNSPVFSSDEKKELNKIYNEAEQICEINLKKKLNKTYAEMKELFKSLSKK